MMNRREFLVGTAALATTVGRLRPVWAANDPKLRAALDRIAHEILQISPMLATSLGLDNTHGKYAFAKAMLDDNSAAARARVPSETQDFKKILGSVPRTSLTGSDAALYDAVAFCLASGERSADFAYGTIGAMGAGAPYVVCQQAGAYQTMPEFLNTQHKIERKLDAQAYLTRIRALGTFIDRETKQLEHDAALGVIAPDFILDTTLRQMKAMRAVSPESSRLVQSLFTRTNEKGIGGDWGGQCTKLVAKEVYPALDRQLAALTAIRGKATSDAGAWKLPKGEAYYQWLLHDATSTVMTPDEIHELGLEQGAAIDAKMDAILRAQGMTQGTVGERMSALTKDPKQLFPNDDAGKAQTVTYVQQRMDALRALLPRVSKMRLEAGVTVKRVPADIEEGAPLGYMNGAALDGSRPAIYYINLHDSSSWPKFTIPTLSAHEGLPGHSWQFAYIAEHRNEVPLVSSVMGFNAFVEGWALYAEQLVDELGFYKDDPFGQLGMYQALRFRCSRLVVDTGIHSKRWTRQKAIETMRIATGRSIGAVTSEVDRYCANPGQACGYKVGHTEIVRLRDKARTALGTKFDVRDFNDVVVRTGGVPLTVLATVIDDWVAKTKG